MSSNDTSSSPVTTPVGTDSRAPLRVVVCWQDISGYMAASVRALAATEGIDLLVVAFVNTRDASAGWFNDTLLAGVNCRLLGPQERHDRKLVEQIVADHHPQAVYLPGWAHIPYRKLAFSPRLADAKFALGLDNPWKGTIQQHLAFLKIGRLIHRVSALVVAGERAWQFAKRLARGESKIYRGSYGFDAAPLKEIYLQRVSAGQWPRRFLFVGRYVALKGFDVLLPAYRKYRSEVSDPWILTCVGDGPMASLIASEPGVENLGWVQPQNLPPILAQSGVFVLASWYEAWSVALAEAMYSGLPAICTEEVGASVDMVRHCYTGLTVPTRDADRLAWAMKWMHEHYDRLPVMGQHAREFASAFTAELFAERMSLMFRQITGLT
jgi:glycosyltransferase involved in cell wall biosynthesis